MATSVAADLVDSANLWALHGHHAQPMFRDEMRAAEQKEREAEKHRREVEAKGPPFCRQIMACEQLLFWCKQYVSKSESKAKEANGAAVAPAEFEGMVAMTKKNIEDDDRTLATSRTKSMDSPDACPVQLLQSSLGLPHGTITLTSASQMSLLFRCKQ
jgi:hypothetical protein